MYKKVYILTCTMAVVLLSVIMISRELEWNPFVSANINEDAIHSDVLQASNQFGFDMLQELTNEEADKSVFISPYSISAALTMTYLGAGEGTKQEMKEALHYQTSTDSQIQSTYQQHLTYLQQDHPGLTIHQANSLWIKDDYPVEEDFLTDTEQFFHADVESRDLTSPQTIGEINRWVNDRTDGQIDQLLTEPFDDRTKLLLLNAIYFNGDWKYPFEKSSTSFNPFIKMDGTSSTVEMMRKEGEVEYKQGEDFLAVRLPYEGEKFSMYVFLPDESMAFLDWISSLKSNWLELTKGFKEAEVGLVELPRFNMEYGLKNLNQTLQTLGMNQAFDETLANFEKINSIQPPLYIKKVLHKAVISVDEEGSEAAAVTSVEMAEESAPVYDVHFKADRPFLYIIADDRFDSILFMGTFLGPNKSEPPL